MPEKILVIGGTGLVGNALVRAWTARGAEVVAATYHCHETPHFRMLDMQDEPVVRRLLDELKPSVVAVPAANPNVDYCELHPEETRGVNVRGTLNVLAACRSVGARMIFFSSDYVFDGEKSEPYNEDDPTNPVNEYGRQKAQVEEAVMRAGAHLVVRTSGAYGWQWEPKNFVLQIRSKVSAGQVIKVADGIRYNPTYVENLAELVCALAEKKLSGIFHAVGATKIKRLDFARQVARAFGLDESKVEGVHPGDFKAPARRPKESSLSTAKIASATGVRVWTADESLKHMVAFEKEWKSYAVRLPAVR